MKVICFLWVLICGIFTADAQNRTQENSSFKTYDSAYSKLKLLLSTNASFQEVVFITENCFYKNSLNAQYIDKYINEYGGFCNIFFQKPEVKGYKQIDTVDFLKNYVISRFMKDTLTLKVDSLNISHLPYNYAFTDPFGKQEWSNMFVTKLLATHKGNCHSLAYLYKILADEIGAKCWLALAPNHIYIRNYSKQIGWYNTELTSGSFPTDAWISLTGYVSTDAIRSGIYMDTLSNQQSIALCLLDLAKGYEFQTHNYYNGFIIKCCVLF